MNIPAPVLKIRKEISKDLITLRDLLYKEFPTSDFSGIETAISELNNRDYIPQVNDKASDPQRWGYDASGLSFRFPTNPRKSKPHPLSNVELNLDIKIRGNVSHFDTFNDPLEALSFDVVIKGDCNGEKHMCTYHLDRHIFKEGDNHPEESHPWYHFQFGGNKLIDDLGEGLNTGNILFLDSPRIPHHPMDLVLGIDFLLSNFFPEAWKNLTDKTSEYNNLIEKYQALILKPYIINFASQWTKAILGGQNVNWKPIDIFPQFK